MTYALTRSFSHASNGIGHATSSRIAAYVPVTGVPNARLLKVVGTAKVTKSNLHNFWYRCLVIDLVLISEILSQASLACTSYRRNKITFIRVNFQVITDQWMVQNVIAALTAAKLDG